MNEEIKETIEMVEARLAVAGVDASNVRRWTCHSDFRGACGVKHRSLRAAVECCARDVRDCKRAGGLSGRYPVPVEG